MKTLREILDNKGHLLAQNKIRLPIKCLIPTEGECEVTHISDRVAVVRRVGFSTDFVKGFSQILVEEKDIVLIPTKSTWGRNGSFAKPMMGGKATVWTSTGCVDCGIQIRHPDFSSKEYTASIVQIYNDRDITIKEDKYGKHFLILVKTPGVQKLFASCKGNYSTVTGSDVKEILEFAKGEVS